MGTNYYFDHNADKDLHIGKSSSGWCFLLRIYPEKGINNLDDMMTMLRTTTGAIRNEYGLIMSIEELNTVITKRSNMNRGWIPEVFMRQNKAVMGPNDLIRHEIDGRFCMGHGSGTWDLVEGDFF